MLNTRTIGSMAKISNHIQQDKQVNQVYVTNDYTKFKTKDGNRSLNELHLKRLKSSVEDNDLLHANPILVNEQFEIIDGQHRFNVCESLCKPIYYIMVKGLGLQEIQILNANAKNWKTEDYVSGYAKLGLPEYKYFETQMNKMDIGVASLLAIFTGDNGNAQESLRNGTLTLPNKKRGEIIYTWIKDFEKLFVGATQRTFVRALVTLYNIDGYNHNKMMQKLQYQSTKLRICNESKSYLALLEEIYNFKERNEKLRFF